MKQRDNEHGDDNVVWPGRDYPDMTIDITLLRRTTTLLGKIYNTALMLIIIVGITIIVIGLKGPLWTIITMSIIAIIIAVLIVPTYRELNQLKIDHHGITREAFLLDQHHAWIRKDEVHKIRRRREAETALARAQNLQHGRRRAQR